MKDEIDRQVTAPDDLENRIVKELRARGVIKSRHHRLRLVAVVASAVVLFAGGYGAAKWTASVDAARSTTTPQFMLLLHTTNALTARGIPEQRLIEEYGQWARLVRANGNIIHGAKLKPVGGQTLSGFFIVAAESLQAAEALAASSPHARYGGRIEIREIDST